VEVRVAPGIARLLREEESEILAEAEASLGIKVELRPDESIQGFEVLRG
jgi:hypothetical protein